MLYEARTNGKIAACISFWIYIWEPAFCLGYDRLVVHCLEAFTTGQMVHILYIFLFPFMFCVTLSLSFDIFLIFSFFEFSILSFVLFMFYVALFIFCLCMFLNKKKLKHISFNKKTISSRCDVISIFFLL